MTFGRVLCPPKTPSFSSNVKKLHYRRQTLASELNRIEFDVFQLASELSYWWWRMRMQQLALIAPPRASCDADSFSNPRRLRNSGFLRSILVRNTGNRNPTVDLSITSALRSHHLAAAVTRRKRSTVVRCYWRTSLFRKLIDLYIASVRRLRGPIKSSQRQR